MASSFHNTPQSPSAAEIEATQRVVKVRRDYNTWVANETLEDYALRFTPHSFRKWSEFRISSAVIHPAASLFFSPSREK